MKRLLAYLFIVLGLGLVFSVNAISATALSEGEGYARILYNKKSEKLNAKKAACKLAKKKAKNHPLLEATGNFNFEHIKSERKIFEKIKEFSVQREGKKKLIFGVKLKK